MRASTGPRRSKEPFGGEDKGKGKARAATAKRKKGRTRQGPRYASLKSGVGGVKSSVELPAKFSGLTNTIGKVITEGVPGAGMIEKLSGGLLKESMIAEKAGAVLKPLRGFLEKRRRKDRQQWPGIEVAREKSPSKVRKRCHVARDRSPARLSRPQHGDGGDLRVPERQVGLRPFREGRRRRRGHRRFPR